jgi:hypothetical protein
MEQFSAARFFGIASAIRDLESFSEDTPFDEEAQNIMAVWLNSLVGDCKAIGLNLSVLHADRLLDDVRKKQIVTTAQFQKHLPELRHRIEDELGLKRFMYVPPERAERYDQKEMFGKDVTAKFPSIQYDCVEAGNCYACARSTAAVFHLMRIMEVGVQQFGTKLGVKLTGEKNWQNILDEVNKAIRALDQKAPQTKELAATSANLYSVKLAWRNEVMHPKDTYTLEETDNLIRQVRIFMEQLATVVS